MAKLNILIYPDRRLRNIAQAVERVDDQVRRHVDDMAETMYAADGIGLASIQVNIPQSIIVMDLSERQDGLMVLINPEIIAREGSQQIEEGCLSFPEYFETVERSAWIRLRALDRSGNQFEMETEELVAACVQHEIDHLSGKLFADYLSRLKRERVKSQFEKRARLRRRNARAA